MREQPKWTPGPWQVDNYPHAPNHPWINAACNRELNPDGGDFYMCVSGAISQDDAHLIAAAPDLAEALKNLIARYDEVVTTPDCSCGQDDHDVTMARAALAKARGEA